jgi:hypothetical protein
MIIASIAFLVGAVIVLVPLFFVIAKTRVEHAEHVFSLWYFYSMSLVIVTCLFAYVYINVERNGQPGIHGLVADVVVFLFYAALNIREEFYFVFGTSAVLVLPQLLAYLIAGSFGCARFPTVLSWIDSFIAWSLIKFFIILAGIMGAQAIFATYGHPYRVPKDIPSRLFYMNVFLSVSFVIFLFHTGRDAAIRIADRLGARERLNSAHLFMTRYTKPRPENEPEYSLEDAITDNVSRWLLARLVRLLARRIRAHIAKQIMRLQQSRGTSQTRPDEVA